MNDDNKIVNQNPPSAVQADQAQPQPAVAPVQPTQPVQPVTPVGSVNKEAGPVDATVSEFIKPSETQPQIDSELKEIGVKEVKDKPDLTFEHKELGVDHAGSNITVSTQPSVPVKLPMSEEEIADKLKTGQDDDSGKWLAGLLQKLIKAFGF